MRIPVTMLASAITALATLASSALAQTYSSTLWQKGTAAVEGLYTITPNDDASHTLTLSANFSTKTAPDLKLVLSPQPLNKITKKNALTGSFVIAPLKSNTGAQTYTIPATVNITKYKTLAIHCEQKTKLWGASQLSEGTVISHAAKWTKKQKKTKGSYELVKRDSGTFIRFSPDFKTPKPPEPLRILLSPLSDKDAKHKNAESGAAFVATLENIKGAQEYRLPDNIDPSNYNSILLNCKQYTKLWSAAPLTPPN